MHSFRHTVLAASALLLVAQWAHADDSVWVSQVSTTRLSVSTTSADRSTLNAMVSDGRAFRPTSTQPNIQNLVTHGLLVDRQVQQTGEGNWVVGPLAAASSTVQVEQNGLNNGVGIQQDGTGHHLRASQAGIGNEMLLTQVGESHRLTATQSGQQNAMSLQQSGSFNTITAIQSGAMKTMGVVQTGSGNRLAAYQR